MALQGSGLEVSVLGVLPAEEVTRTLSRADALLFVRGQISPRRGSAIAGVACGLPIVGYGDSESSFPIDEAGVRLVPRGNREALAAALREVLTDGKLWDELHERNRNAYEEYFSWEQIAGRYVQVLENG